jgi:hypothetical protein
MLTDLRSVALPIAPVMGVANLSLDATSSFLITCSFPYKLTLSVGLCPTFQIIGKQIAPDENADLRDGAAVLESERAA